MLIYVTLRYVVMLCYVIMLCYVTLRYVMLCNVTLRYVTLRYITLRYITLCYVMLYVMLCYVICYVMLRYCRKYVHEVLVNPLGGLSLPRKSVVRLTDHPYMTLDVYRGRKTTIQQQRYVTLCYVRK